MEISEVITKIKKLHHLKEQIMKNEDFKQKKDIIQYIEIKTDYIESLYNGRNISFDEYYYRRTTPFSRKIFHIIKYEILKVFKNV